MKYYIEYLYSRDYDRRKMYDLVKQQIELSDIPVEDSYELDFLTKCAQSDFTHYIYAKLGYYKKFNFDEKRARIKLCELLYYKEDKVRRVLREWLDWWYLKWRQRVKIIFETEKSSKDNLKNGLQPAEELLSKVRKRLVDYYRRLAITALVEVHEVCSLDIISDYLLKVMTLGMISRYGKNRTLSLLSYRHDLVRLEIMKRAVEISKVTQPLVVLKVRVNVRNGGST